MRTYLLSVFAVVLSSGAVLAQSQRPPQPAYETVRFPSAAPGAPEIRALLLKSPQAKAPTVMMLHGCGGLFTPSGRLLRREIDWATRFQSVGYNVLMVDSFGSRGLGSQCTTAERSIRLPARARDVQGALVWLNDQAWADRSRVALIGWSNGGSTVLNAVGRDFVPAQGGGALSVAMAIYPGCRVFLDRPPPRPDVSLEIHMGDADDWTPPGPCVELAKVWSVPIELYPNAYHGFDAPDTPIRVRTGLAFSANGDGRAHVGTNPEQRQKFIEAVMTRLEAAFAVKR
jgi:dienelactone hydrolase